MTFPQLLQRANEAYERESGGLVSLTTYFNLETGERIETGGGDTLALFIGLELRDTFDSSKMDDDQLTDAANAMDSAAKQLTNLSTEFDLA